MVNYGTASQVTVKSIIRWVRIACQIFGLQRHTRNMWYVSTDIVGLVREGITYTYVCAGGSEDAYN
jgi:hypothetical protein